MPAVVDGRTGPAVPARVVGQCSTRPDSPTGTRDSSGCDGGASAAPRLSRWRTCRRRMHRRARTTSSNWSALHPARTAAMSALGSISAISVTRWDAEDVSDEPKGLPSFPVDVVGGWVIRLGSNSIAERFMFGLNG